MLNLELLAQGGDHSIVKVCTVVSDDPFGDTVPTYKVLLDEVGNNVLSDRREGSCFNPLRKVINFYQDEMMPVGCRRSDLADHINAPHCKRPRSFQDVKRNQRYVPLISIDLALVTGPRMLITVGFYCGPIISCPKDFLFHGVSTGMSPESTFM